MGLLNMAKWLLRDVLLDGDKPADILDPAPVPDLPDRPDATPVELAQAMRGRERFAREARQKDWAFCPLGVHCFDRHFAVQRYLARQVNLAHSATAQLLDNLVAANLIVVFR